MKYDISPSNNRSARRNGPTDNLLHQDSEREACLLVGLELRRAARKSAGGSGQDLEYSTEESIRELAELAEGAGAKVLGSVVQVRDQAEPATLIGRGKVNEIHNLVEELDVDAVLFDQDLTPTQQRNLERLWGRKVIDRTQLILDIFASHARTREGQLQVELAQLDYLRPRLTGHGAEMSRLGGGIGTRGPGETKLESDRRRIAQRIEKLKQDLESVRDTRRQQRKKRMGIPLSTIALVGYTNAGKSTLFNALTSAHVLADARMFATLDPTIRVLELPSNRQALLSDTVGFIRNLPTGLIQSFRATLEEVTEASMILHVVDAASPHRREQMHEVAKVLRELEANRKPQILVFNKIDRLEPGEAARIVESERSEGSAADVLAISARARDGLPPLVQAIDHLLPGDDVTTQRYHFSHSQGDRISFLYQHARVLERADTVAGVDLVVAAPESVRRRMLENAVKTE